MMFDRRRALRNYARIAAVFCLSICVFGAAQQQAASRLSANQSARPDPARWGKDIAAFEAWDRKNSPPRDALLFVGSSSIVGWETARSFPEWPVINRGFGGPHVSEVTAHFERVIAPYDFRVLVLYAGDNDIASGLSPAQVADDFAAFVERVRGKFPETPIVFLSIKPSRARWEHWEKMQEANRRIAAYCEKHPRLHYVDLSRCLLDEKSEPREELYLADRLHLNPKGYAAWDGVLLPQLKELLDNAKVNKAK